MTRLWLGACALVLALPFTGQAQEAATPAPSPAPVEETLTTDTPAFNVPILVFDRARVVSESPAGRARQAELEAAQLTLLEENVALEQALEEEELALTELKETLDTESFNARALEFDDKVTQTRRAQDEKLAALTANSQASLVALESTMNSLIAGVAQQLNAVVIFERSQVYMLAGGIDVTDILVRDLTTELIAENSGNPAPAESNN